MNNNLEFENEDPSPDSIEDNHPRTNYGEGYYVKETLEEAAEEWIKGFGGITNSKNSFEEGANWQQERMYSEDEVYEILAQFVNDAPTVTKEWFEQFKKK